jgi:hypothetical protein
MRFFKLPYHVRRVGRREDRLSKKFHFFFRTGKVSVILFRAGVNRWGLTWRFANEGTWGVAEIAFTARSILHLPLLCQRA